jgi:hypothetical protein
MTHGNYHLKELVWFQGWTPTHWLLVETSGGLTARCTRTSDSSLTPPVHQTEEPVTDEMLLKIEKTVPGSLPAVMGFEFVICDGLPGSIVLNRPLKFSMPPSKESEQSL